MHTIQVIVFTIEQAMSSNIWKKFLFRELIYMYFWRQIRISSTRFPKELYFDFVFLISIKNFRTRVWTTFMRWVFYEFFEWGKFKRSLVHSKSSKNTSKNSKQNLKISFIWKLLTTEVRNFHRNALSSERRKIKFKVLSILPSV